VERGAMTAGRVTRDRLLSALEETLRPLDYVHAMWEAGAIAFGRVDEWSDIDLQIVSDDDRVEDTFAAVESALRELSPIDATFRFPEPVWHGHSQAFYRLRDASPYLLLDLVVMKLSNENRFLVFEIHGRPFVYFDKSDIVVPEPFDAQAMSEKIRDRIEGMRARFDMFQVMVTKEVERGNAIEAAAYYQATTLRPLVEMLRILHGPVRHDFHTRYIYDEFPEAVLRRLDPLFFPRDLRDLESKREAAQAWFHELEAEVGDGPGPGEILDGSQEIGRRARP
jgi:predicted nucleotidyltransferase